MRLAHFSGDNRPTGAVGTALTTRQRLSLSKRLSYPSARASSLAPCPFVYFLLCQKHLFICWFELFDTHCFTRHFGAYQMQLSELDILSLIPVMHPGKSPSIMFFWMSSYTSVRVLLQTGCCTIFSTTLYLALFSLHCITPIEYSCQIIH